MQHDAADELDVEMAQAHGAPARFATQRESLDQKLV